MAMAEYNYSDAQLEAYVKMVEEDEIIKVALSVLDYDQEKNMKEIKDSTELSIYTRDKALLALYFAGFAEKREKGGSKVYRLTAEGKRLKDIMDGRNVN